jgi:hypothetical protein
MARNTEYYDTLRVSGKEEEAESLRRYQEEQDRVVQYYTEKWAKEEAEEKEKNK